MTENIILGIITVISTVRGVAYGIWNIRSNNKAGGTAVIFVTLTAAVLIGIYIYFEML